MAQAIACDLCGQESAVMLETRIETGEVIAVGASCLGPFYAGGLREVLRTVTPEIAAEYGEILADAWPESAQAGDGDATGDDGATQDALSREDAKFLGAVTDNPGDGASTDTLPGTDDASVSGKGITVTADRPARQAHNRARAPK